MQVRIFLIWSPLLFKNNISSLSTKHWFHPWIKTFSSIRSLCDSVSPRPGVIYLIIRTRRNHHSLKQHPSTKQKVRFSVSTSHDSLVPSDGNPFVSFSAVSHLALESEWRGIPDRALLWWRTAQSGERTAGVHCTLLWHTVATGFQCISVALSSSCNSKSK